MTRIKWVQLIYKIPRTPASKRVYVWRRLKKLGSLLLQDAVSILPYTKRNLEHFQWLAAEIEEMDGEALVLESYSVSKRQEEKIVKAFEHHVDELYQAVLAELGRMGDNPDIGEVEPKLKIIIQDYLAAQQFDFFQSKLKLEIEARLTAIQHAVIENKYGKEREP